MEQKDCPTTRGLTMTFMEPFRSAVTTTSPSLGFRSECRLAPLATIRPDLSSLITLDADARKPAGCCESRKALVEDGGLDSCLQAQNTAQPLKHTFSCC